ncbi:MAG: RNA polymerase sigma factor, partial [Pyrinomonadaceae bacterium]
MKHYIDEQLIGEAINGNAAAFSEIYFALRDSIFGYAYRMLGETAAAEDIAHDVFIFFIENPQKYQPDRGNLHSFLCGVARNQILHYLRKGNARFEINRDEEDENFVEPEDEISRDPLKNLLAEELAEKLETEIAKLSPPLREVVLLREMQELSYAEIAEITGAEMSAVKVRLHRARKILAHRLAPYFIERKKEENYELCG